MKKACWSFFNLDLPVAILDPPNTGIRLRYPKRYCAGHRFDLFVRLPKTVVITPSIWSSLTLCGLLVAEVKKLK